MGGSSARTDKEPRWNDCLWLLGSTVCLLGLWSDSSDAHTSADIAGQCLGCIAKFVDASLQHTQYSCYFSLRTPLSGQTYNTQQYLLLQITCIMPSNAMVTDSLRCVCGGRMATLVPQTIRRPYSFIQTVRRPHDFKHAARSSQALHFFNLT